MLKTPSLHRTKWLAAKWLGGSALAALLMVAVAPASFAGALHGFCAGSGQCVDNGTNSPTSSNPPASFGFTASGGPQSGFLFIDILTPNSSAAPSGFTLGGTLSGTASQIGSTAWTSGSLAGFLGISASPNNPIGAYLPSTQTLAPSATGFFVYQAGLGSATLQSPSNPGVSPLETLSTSLPTGSYILAFLDQDGDYTATANSGAIFVTGTPTKVPEPGTVALLGTGLIGLLLLGRGLKRRR